MKVKLTKGRAAAQEDIVMVQRKVGAPLSTDFIEFLARHDGAKPENNIFKVGPNNHGGINDFIPVRKIPSEMSRIENLPAKSFPFAWAEGGNYVFLNIGLMVESSFGITRNLQVLSSWQIPLRCS